MEAADHGRQDGRSEAQGDSGSQQPHGAGMPPPALAGESALATSRPEILVGAAFVGGLLAAKAIRLARR